MYNLAVKEGLDKKFRKLKKKDREMLASIDRKVQDILDDPYRFKPFKETITKQAKSSCRRIFCTVNIDR